MYRSVSLAALMPSLLVICCIANGQNPKDSIQQKLVAEYALTQPTADYTDIVTAGAVLVLKKNNLVMTPASSSTAKLYQDLYKNGQVNPPAIGRFDALRHSIPGQGGTSNRTFVPGEKVWVTKIDVKDDGIVFDLLSDPYSDVRYKAALKFWFPKGETPSVDEADKIVAQVFSVQPSDAGNNQQQTTASAQPPPTAGAGPAPHVQPAAATEAPPAPIAPPPPPADQPPPTIGLGATPDQVVASFGQPQKQIKLGSKLIYVYKDMKVTFVNNKVTDVQ